MVKVDVTDYDIEYGDTGSLSTCALAQAVNRQLKIGLRCEIGIHTRIVNSRNKWLHSWVTTRDTCLFVADFDNGTITPETPREFIFEIPEEYLK